MKNKIGSNEEKKTLNYKIVDNCIHSNGEWVVFIHGAGGSIMTWSRQIEDFSQHYKLLLVDLRDHGDSKGLSSAYQAYNFDLISNDLHAVLQKEEITKAHFVTLSFGSILIQHFMMKFPSVPIKTVAAGGIFDTNWKIKFFVKIALGLNHLIPFRKMYSIFSYLLMPRKRNQLARRVYQRQALKLSPRDYYKWLGLYDEFFNLLKDFSNLKIKNKLMVIMGSQDYVFFNSAKTYSERTHNVQMKTINNAGHICNIEEPKIFNEMALRFLRE